MMSVEIKTKENTKGLDSNESELFSPIGRELASKHSSPFNFNVIAAVMQIGLSSSATTTSQT